MDAVEQVKNYEKDAQGVASGPAEEFDLYPGWADLKVIEAQQFSSGFYGGYKILKVIHSQDLHRECLTRTLDVLDQYGNTKCGSDDQVFVISKPLLLIGRPTRTVEAALREEIQNLNNLRRKLHQEMKALEEAQKAAHQDYAKLVKDRDFAQKNYHDTLDKLTAIQTQTRVYEQDMAKLRKALGEIRLNEILSPEVLPDVAVKNKWS